MKQKDKTITKESINQKNKIWFSRMLWSSRRGMLEVDYFLQSFLNSNLNLSEKEKQDYEKLLEFNDNDIYSWLVKKTKVEDSSLKPILEKIRQSAKKTSQNSHH